MTDKIRILVNEVESYLEDFILSRKEKKDFRTLIQNTKLDDQQKMVFLSQVRDMLSKPELKLSDADRVSWFYELSKNVATSSSDDSNFQSRVAFSPGTACREMICNAIRFTHDSMRICVFTISDDEITEEILRAHRMGRDIKIITDNDKSFDLGSDIERMEQAGIPIIMDNTSAHMHHKFAVFDKKKLLTGSYNWTRSAATSNHENIIETNDAHLIKTFVKEFDDLWKELG